MRSLERVRRRVPRRAPTAVAPALPAQRFALVDVLDIVRAGVAGRTWRVLWGDWSDSALFAPVQVDSQSPKERI